MFKYLPKLFENAGATELLSKLTEKVLIAGGSVVYDQMAKKNKIDKSEINDVDLFVFQGKDQHTQIEEIITIISKYISIEEISIGIGTYFKELGDELTKELTNEDQIDGEDPDDEISVINVKLEGESTLFQIIITDCKTPLEVLNSFDMDYVQTGYYQNKFYITKFCIKSHTDSQIYKISPKVKSSRLLKAATKGFKTILFESDVTTKRITYEKILFEQLKKLKLRPIIKNEELINVGKFKYYQRRKDFKTFENKSGDEIVISKYFFEIKVDDNVIIPKVKTIAIRCKVIDVVDGVYLKVDLVEYTKTIIWIDLSSEMKFKKGETYVLMVRGVNSSATGVIFKPLKVVRVVDIVNSDLISNIMPDITPPKNSYELLEFLSRHHSTLEMETRGKKSRALHIKSAAYKTFLYYIKNGKSEEKAIRKSVIQSRYDFDKWFDSIGARPISYYEFKYKKIGDVLEMINKIESKFVRYTPIVKIK